MNRKRNYNRASTRLPVSPSEIKGSIVDQDGTVDPVVLVWNISVQGLCLWVAHQHKQGSTVTVHVETPWKGELECVVRWCRTIPDKSGYLVGLEAEGESDSLKSLHSRLAKKAKTSA